MTEDSKSPFFYMETYRKIHGPLAHRNIHVPSITTPCPQDDEEQSTPQDRRIG